MKSRFKRPERNKITARGFLADKCIQKTVALGQAFNVNLRWTGCCKKRCHLDGHLVMGQQGVVHEGGGVVESCCQQIWSPGNLAWIYSSYNSVSWLLGERGETNSPEGLGGTLKGKISWPKSAARNHSPKHSPAHPIWLIGAENKW